jgi:hypothetical protein
MTNELTQEQIDAVIKVYEVVRDIAEKLVEIVLEAFQTILDYIREFGVRLGRMLFMQQLLKWRIPPKLASFIAEKMYWWVACRIGYRWLSINFKRGYTI